MADMSGSPGANEMTFEQIKETALFQMQMNIVQTLTSAISDKCFERCVTKPGSRLDSSETSCVSRCTQRFLEARSIVAAAYVKASSASREFE
ncbi:hypothetical protein H696_04556 [Fonticula alba]|uniref:Mitochondrial import inner membrane translocase subunit n=1 Tax=Fonticula alba TaxID=691883 RepID=A0A058Z4T3_FONAL|nr:hypothetical protein H696_04556 [Fonticula alba]KCV69141.1 hypothetical protein H696_04556 [Fonticula alba]|eukprot:XP_009496712.1 hypothetical protein H696_04556 [Fonticula alba]